MNDNASITAQRVAERRAAHQLLDKPLVFEDPIALRIVDPGADVLARESTPIAPFMRAAFAVRSRYTEDELREAVARGVRQYVLLGAGFDTFAYRNPFPELRVFEVDHPATQELKRRRLAGAGIQPSGPVEYVPVDFSRQTLASALSHLSGPAFFSWLGVVPYLERPSIEETLRFVASLPAGTTIVFDYGTPPHRLSPIGRRVFEALSARVAAAGEPWKTFFDSSELDGLLHAAGFSRVDQLGPAEINARYFGNRADGLRVGEMMRLAKAVV